MLERAAKLAQQQKKEDRLHYSSAGLLNVCYLNVSRLLSVF